VARSVDHWTRNLHSRFETERLREREGLREEQRSRRRLRAHLPDLPRQRHRHRRLRRL